MAVAMTREGQTIRVEWLRRWYLRLPSLPFLAAALYFLSNVALIVRADVSGAGRWSDDWVGLVFYIGFALLVGTPGLILATLRYFIELDKALRRIVITRQFGPLKIRSLRQHSDFKFISIVDGRDKDSALTMYDVSLCGGKGVRPILVSSFAHRREANDFARELGDAFELPPRDYVGTS